MPVASPARRVSPPWGPLAAAAVAALVVAAASWPAPIAPNRWIIGPSGNDFHGIAWTLHHVAGHLAEGRLPPLHTTALGFPEGATLLPADLPELTLLAPLTLLAGPTVAFNALQLLHHALAAAAAWWCAGACELAPAGRALCALAFAFAPALTACTFNQNPDVTAWYWVPLAAGLAARARGPRGAAAAGLCAGLGAACNPYGGVMAALASGVLLTRPAPDRGRRLLAWLVPLALIGGAAALAAWWAVGVTDSATPRGDRHTQSHGVAALLDLVDPRRVTGPVTRLRSGEIVSRVSHSAYLGWSLLVLGLPMLVQRPRWGVVGGIALLLALGPEIALDEASVLASPVALLERMPGLRQLHLSHRFTALVVLALALGAGALASRLGRAGWLLPALVAVDLLGPGQGWAHLASQEVTDDDGCRALRDRPPGPVLDLPSDVDERWLGAATCHGNPVAQTLNGPMSASVTAVLDDPDSAPAGLSALGFRYVVIHRSARRGDLRAIPRLERATRGCSERVGDVTVIDLDACGRNSGGPRP